MTEKRAAILAFVSHCIAAQGYAPTLREIGDHHGISHVTAKGHVDRLIKDGDLIRTGVGAREIAIPANGVQVAVSRLRTMAVELDGTGWGRELLVVIDLLTSGRVSI